MFHGKALLDKLQRGEVCLGTWVMFRDPVVMELLCGSDFDFVVIDAEHGAFGIETLTAHFIAAEKSGIPVIVRVPSSDPASIKPVLDAGAGGILVPLLRSADEVAQAVAACRYPPEGVRGYNPWRASHYGRDGAEYMATANGQVVVWVMIERIEAVEEIEAIVRTPGLHGLVLGPADLSASLGLLGQPNHPDVVAAIEKTIAAAREAHLPVGLPGSDDPDQAFAWLERGMQFVALGGDFVYLLKGSQEALSGVRRLIEARS